MLTFRQFALFLLCALPQHAVAQPAPDIVAGCTVSQFAAPPRQIISCPGGVVIEAAAGAVLQLVVATPKSTPHAVILLDGAALIEVAPGGEGFQIRTPQAIASVRGTVWAVDVAAGNTAVFVERGQVAVNRPGGLRQVLLGAGQGVDVTPGQSFAPRDWPNSRSAALLARFGR